ncbi:glycosyltransferase family 2 protein [Hymenobacter sp. GOD-10R]|uniref:glycosyltransferase family 2 protein n=1 Tax=Hymenobacter sp. GOD-10R TaxID=3093922 RepID=UPI002D793B88|nr:glycosyltransferase [Hymenobacter sp. GOD-10R]WRQ30348.1 glycosyltransferase [Hymenobacter sp. GOD-10R]
MASLSIIVPVYNKEKYLDEAIASILAQTWTDFELILVDDGSEDGSGAICDRYASLDSRVVVVHQANRGVSAARNTGLEMSQGTYIGFVDSDDVIEADMYELLLCNARQYNADISVCGMKVIPMLKKHQEVGDHKEVRVVNRRNILPLVFDGTLDWSANNKVYKADIAKSVQFSGRINEDLFYVFLTHKQAEVVVFDESKKYYYLKRDNSVSNQRFNRSQMEGVAVSEKILKITTNEYPEHIDHAKRLDLISTISILNLMMFSFQKDYVTEYTSIKQKLLSYNGFVNNSGLVSKKHRYAYLAFKMSPALYQWLLQVYCYLFESEVGNKVM